MTIAVSPTSMSGTLRSRACRGREVQWWGVRKLPSISDSCPQDAHLDDVAIAQREEQLRLVLHTGPVLQGRL